MIELAQGTAFAGPCSTDDHKAVVAFLSDPASYPDRPQSVQVTETHMSFVFIAGDRVYKIKKPIRLGFVDFTALAARRHNCERELSLNQRLAPGVYLGIMPLMRLPGGQFALGSHGVPVEWIVVMSRLDDDKLLDRMLAHGDVQPAGIDRLCGLLAGFYAETARIVISPDELVARWRIAIDLVAKSLTDPIFALPAAAVAQPIAALRGVLDHDAGIIAARAIQGRIVDGHGDMRPEHVHLGPPTLIIDCLEFDEQLRQLDPFEEACFLGIECERLGAGWIGPYLVECLSKRLCDRPLPVLLRFYRCYRACLRARQSIEHMRDPYPRTPEKWPRQTHEYLAIAMNTLP